MLCALVLDARRITTHGQPMGAVPNSRSLRIQGRGDWRGARRTTNTAELAAEIEGLYLLLFNLDSLPVRRVELESDKTISEISYELGIVHGSYFPQGIDALFCDINPQICRREKHPVSQDKATNVAAHIGGYAISPGKWSNSRGDHAYLVDLAFDEDVGLVRRRVPSGTSVAALLNRERPNCETYGIDCVELAAFINPSVVDLSHPLDEETWMVLPTPRVNTVLPLQEAASRAALGEAFEFDELPSHIRSNSDVIFYGPEKVKIQTPEAVKIVPGGSPAICAS